MVGKLKVYELFFGILVLVSEIEIQGEESDEEKWQVFQSFACPLCTFSSPKQQITAEHMFSHIQVHNLRAPKGTLGPAFD